MASSHSSTQGRAKDIVVDQDEDDLSSDLLFGPSPASRIQTSVRYGPISMSIIPTEGRAHSLLADHIFNPAFIIAEWIDMKMLGSGGEAVLELGAGSGLPSLLLSTLSDRRTPSTVVLTEYPDEPVLRTLQSNVDRNKHLARCSVHAAGYIWGDEKIDHLVKLLPPQKTGFDIMILSDLLWFSSSHRDLLTSILLLLSKPSRTSQGGKVIIASGTYTPIPVFESFFNLLRSSGLKYREIHTDKLNWGGKLDVDVDLSLGQEGGVEVDRLSEEERTGRVREAMLSRKSNVRMWECCWAS